MNNNQDMHNINPQINNQNNINLQPLNQNNVGGNINQPINVVPIMNANNTQNPPGYQPTQTFANNNSIQNIQQNPNNINNQQINQINNNVGFTNNVMTNNNTELNNLNINGAYHDMPKIDYSQDPKVRENLNKKNTITVTSEGKTFIIIIIVLLIFIFVLPTIFDFIMNTIHS